MILHIINRSPFTTNHLKNCLEVISPEDALLFMDDGVYALQGDLLKNLPFKIHAIEMDLQARGLNGSNSSATLINYAQMVELVAKYPLSKTWF